VGQLQLQRCGQRRCWPSTTRTARGGRKLWDFFYEAFKIAVEKRYAAAEGSFGSRAKETWHGMLADYFHDQDFWRESLGEQRRQAGAVTLMPRSANRVVGVSARHADALAGDASGATR
jgi:hypothetical protein